MHTAKHRRFLRLLARNLTLVAAVVALEASVFAVNCLEHLTNTNEPAHHALWEVAAADHHAGPAPHAHPSATPVEGKALQCHMDDGAGPAQFGALVSFLPESVTPTADVHAPGPSWAAALRPDEPLRWTSGFIDPPKRPPRLS